jgi:hypothetical protein
MTLMSKLSRTRLLDGVLDLKKDKILLVIKIKNLFQELELTKFLQLFPLDPHTEWDKD